MEWTPGNLKRDLGATHVECRPLIRTVRGPSPPVFHGGICHSPCVSSGSPAPCVLGTRFPRPPHSHAPFSGIGSRRGAHLLPIVSEHFLRHLTWTLLTYFFFWSRPHLLSVTHSQNSLPSTVRHGASPRVWGTGLR